MREKVLIVLMALASISALYYMGSQTNAVPLENAGKGDLVEFQGLCVYSSGDFSVLYNGSASVAVFGGMEVGKAYRILGKVEDPEKDRLKLLEINETSPEFLPLEAIEGAYWSDCRLLTPERVYMYPCLNVSKGEYLRAMGLFYRGKLYVVNYTVIDFRNTPEDGMPLRIEGSVIYGGNPATIWNGEPVKVYLPYGMKLKPGDYVRVLGIVRLYSTLTVYVEDRRDVEVLGKAVKRPIGEESVGEIAYGECLVSKSNKRYLKLNCTSLPLYGFFAHVGDSIKFQAIRRENSLYCLNCEVSTPRERLNNTICRPVKGPSKIEGNVEWVKVYANGFGLANVTDGSCWVLLKLRKSLGVTLREGEHVVAFGYHTTYRGMGAFEVYSREDVVVK
ncbi:hypothetical protein A3L12_02910 [Thermococcus sp. P6]|uniref:hypothetical protein n=1 Tax=Thermococcus sp. P6 TaxID=122420 RepID=UPI000B59C117|nr:hypothetical protein [Thermococcus sp. P6]ASJ10320.1 hypothetical protein A3L12_02910 [Thermococcus sp. P6]